MFADYDLAFVPSDFSKYPSKKDGISHKIRTTGYPRTDPLIKKTLSRRDLLKTIGLPFNEKNILYAPTWGRYHRNFLWENEEIFEDIEEFCQRNKCSFLIRMHYAWYQRNPRKREKLKKKIEQNKHIFNLSSEKYADVQHVLYITDVLITDWSSIANDFILLNKPIIYLDIEHPALDAGAYLLTPHERVGYIVKSKAGFFQKLQEAMDNPKLFKKLYEKKRRAVIEKIYKHLDGNSSKRCAQEIIRLLKDNSLRREKKNDVL